MRRRMPNVTKIRELIDWCPDVFLDQTLRRIINFYRMTEK
ncbi:hypothetical protein D1BOALGB6SA_5457 [Olavius sp. associated proteobacterium Delta 1]|nr:hypothetical protein D1BOALGB6SA_5457 [Olavius sp. associated proteobacterium Delta 1]